MKLMKNINIKTRKPLLVAGFVVNLKSLNNTIYMTNLCNSNEEVWLPVLGYEKYYKVSNFGRVKTLVRHGERGHRFNSYESIVKLCVCATGYYVSGFNKDKKTSTKKTHRIVATAFIPNPLNKKCVNHKDGNKLNNHVSNLEWATHAENNKHAYDKGLKVAARGQLSSNGKYTEDQVRQAKTLFKHGMKPKEIEKIIPIGAGALRGIVYGANWKWVEV